MGSSSSLTLSPFPSFFPFPNPNPTKISSKNPQILKHVLFQTQSRNQKSEKNSLSCLTTTNEPPPPVVQSSNVSERLKSLDFEFKSLPEPIDRVKRLLHYAAHLPPLDESSRIQENRVLGCTAQVWLEVGMDGNGLMRFGVDSDSEITKGFCSCLIWVLDGAEAHEVLSVRSDDLIEMNVGLPNNSRVNTWHNVLIRMQKRTKDLVEERDREKKQALEGIIVNGSCKEIQRRNVIDTPTISIGAPESTIRVKGVDSGFRAPRTKIWSANNNSYKPMNFFKYIGYRMIGGGYFSMNNRSS